jgi:hypothetical protein
MNEWDLFVQLAEAQLWLDGDVPDVWGNMRTELLDIDVAAVDRLPRDAVLDSAKSVSGVPGILAVRLGVAGLTSVVARVREARHAAGA